MSFNEPFVHQPVRRQHSFIPDPYYKICMDALRVFSRGSVSLGSAIMVAVNASNHPKANRADARRYLLKWLREDAKFE